MRKSAFCIYKQEAVSQKALRSNTEKQESLKKNYSVFLTGDHRTNIECFNNDYNYNGSSSFLQVLRGIGTILYL